jgi:hypothetical protein
MLSATKTHQIAFRYTPKSVFVLLGREKINSPTDQGEIKAPLH